MLCAAALFPAQGAAVAAPHAFLRVLWWLHVPTLPTAPAAVTFPFVPEEISGQGKS